VPCIECNAIASVKEINAARLALHGDGTHRVSLDQAIATMRQTGLDMSHKYRKRRSAVWPGMSWNADLVWLSDQHLPPSNEQRH
jgi:hypothetical protein